MDKTYRYKPNRRLPSVSAQILGEELDRIATARGTLDAPGVVEESRPDDAVLHSEFEWNDGVAGERYREYQARNIINVIAIEVMHEERTAELPAFVNVVEGPVSAPEIREYRAIGRVLADPHQRSLLVQRCKEKLDRVYREFSTLSEFASVWQAIEGL